MSSSLLAPALVLAAGLGLALAAPLYSLLIADLLLGAWPVGWELGGVLLDPTDLVLASLLAGLLLRGRLCRPPQVPYLGLWLLLGVLLCVSYLAAPTSQGNLTGPLRITYQLYRYCWKPILFYPLAAVLLCRRDRLRVTWVAIVIAGDLFALQGLPDGYAGLRASGPFRTANELGAVLVVPILTALGLLLIRPSRRSWLLALASLPVLLRAFLFTGSRGAFAAVLVATGLMLGLLFKAPGVRPRIWRLALGSAVLGLLLMVAKPGLTQRPNVKRFLTLSQGTEASTFRWRIEERWPHFWRIAIASPWLGTGTIVDPGLSDRANTPHNGYLALAVKLGFPTLALYLAFGAAALGNSMRLRRIRGDPRLSAFGALNAAVVVALLVHNLVDSTILMPFIAKLFWLHTAFAAVAARRPELFLAPVEPYQEAGPVAPAAPGTIPAA